MDQLPASFGVEGEVLGVGAHGPARIARKCYTPALMRISERVTRAVERGLSRAAHAAWPLVERYNARFERPSPHPRWAPGPLPKRRERTFPELGWPRETDSLCPACVKEVRAQVLGGERDLSTLVSG